MKEMFACIHIPNFVVQAAMRHERELWKHPVAILDGPEAHQKIVALNQAARDLGGEIGMTRPQAEASPEIVLRTRSIAQEESAHATLLDCASAVSPRVESTK